MEQARPAEQNMDADHRRPGHKAVAPPDQRRTAIAQQARTTPGGRSCRPPFHGLAAFPLHHNSSEPRPDKSMFPRQERGGTASIWGGNQTCVVCLVFLFVWFCFF